MLFKKIIIPFCMLILTSITCPANSIEPDILGSLSQAEQQQLQSGEIIVREVETHEPTGQTFEVIGIMRTSALAVVQLLMDYESYPDYQSAVHQIEVVEVHEDGATLNYILESMLGVTKRHRIRLSMSQSDDAHYKVGWSLVEWPGLKPFDTIKDTRGYWMISQQTPQSTLVHYYVYSDPGPVPFGLGMIVNSLSKSSIIDAYRETRTEVEKRFTTP